MINSLYKHKRALGKGLSPRDLTVGRLFFFSPEDRHKHLRGHVGGEHRGIYTAHLLQDWAGMEPLWKS